MTGFIVESEADAVAAIGRARYLDRRRIRERFERRFSARRMAEAYVESYQALLESAHSRAADRCEMLIPVEAAHDYETMPPTEG